MRLITRRQLSKAVVVAAIAALCCFTLGIGQAASAWLANLK